MKKFKKKSLITIVLLVSALVITSCGSAPTTDKGANSTPGDKIIEEKGAEEKSVEENLESKESDKEIKNNEELSESDREIGIYPNMQVPELTLLDRTGNELSLSDYRGKIVFLNFWATTCPYCIDEMPDLEKFYNTHKDEEDFALIGVNMTKTWEKKSKEKLIEWLDNEGFTFPVVFDETGDTAAEWMAHSLPVTFVVTEEGVSLGAIMGKTNFETLEGVLEEVRDM